MKGNSVIIGGGLAGLMCARRLLVRGRPFKLINAPVTTLGHGLGGFAEFSGAKFSLLPAGTGLIPVAGSEQRLRGAIEDVTAILGLTRFRHVQSSDMALDFSESLRLRAYHSYVLMPSQIGGLISELAAAVPTADVLEDRVTAVTFDGNNWRVQMERGELVEGRAVVFASGRTGANLLAAAGAVDQPGRGTDLGVRLEFLSQEPLAPLRALGADAKVLWENCRTFCLNSPGAIFHYPADEGILIPGGVVAEPSVTAANVGLLCRVPNKRLASENFKRAAKKVGQTRALSYKANTRSSIIDGEVLTPFFGKEVVAALSTFVEKLDESKLIRLGGEIKVHYPLIDWHWPTFALPASFRTSMPGLYVIGDLAGHARGLLQSAVSGWLAGEEL